MDVSYAEELMSVREASKESGRNTETVRRWIWSGKLEVVPEIRTAC
jgi:hypothetical protein